MSLWPDGNIEISASPLAPCMQWREAPDAAARAVEEIIDLVRARTGVDFSLYRRATVQRRIGNRMISLGSHSVRAYVEHLRADVAEAAHLLQRLTIKVSRFYRNAHTFEFLAREVLPRLAQSRGGAPLRLWSAGCGCGEEAYTLAMLLDRAGLDGIVEATDIDAAALAAAAHGVYRGDVTEELPPSLAQTYLEPLGEGAGARYRVRDVLRERVRFTRHDLTGTDACWDAGHFDLVCCRNVLIYFNRAAQRHVFQTLATVLAGDGYLCIGEAEWPLPESELGLLAQGNKTQVFRRVAPKGACL